VPLKLDSKPAANGDQFSSLKGPSFHTINKSKMCSKRLPPATNEEQPSSSRRPSHNTNETGMLSKKLHPARWVFLTKHLPLVSKRELFVGRECVPGNECQYLLLYMDRPRKVKSCYPYRTKQQQSSPSEIEQCMLGKWLCSVISFKLVNHRRKIKPFLVAQLRFRSSMCNDQLVGLRSVVNIMSYTICKERWVHSRKDIKFSSTCIEVIVLEDDNEFGCNFGAQSGLNEARRLIDYIISRTTLQRHYPDLLCICSTTKSIADLNPLFVKAEEKLLLMKLEVVLVDYTAGNSVADQTLLQKKYHKSCFLCEENSLKVKVSLLISICMSTRKLSVLMVIWLCCPSCNGSMQWLLCTSKERITCGMKCDWAILSRDEPHHRVLMNIKILQSCARGIMNWVFKHKMTFYGDREHVPLLSFNDWIDIFMDIFVLVVIENIWLLDLSHNCMEVLKLLLKQQESRLTLPQYVKGEWKLWKKHTKSLFLQSARNALLLFKSLHNQCSLVRTSPFTETKPIRHLLKEKMSFIVNCPTENVEMKLVVVQWSSPFLEIKTMQEKQTTKFRAKSVSLPKLKIFMWKQELSSNAKRSISKKKRLQLPVPVPNYESNLQEGITVVKWKNRVRTHLCLLLSKQLKVAFFTKMEKIENILLLHISEKPLQIASKSPFIFEIFNEDVESKLDFFCKLNQLYYNCNSTNKLHRSDFVASLMSCITKAYQTSSKDYATDFKLFIVAQRLMMKMLCFKKLSLCDLATCTNAEKQCLVVIDSQNHALRVIKNRKQLSLTSVPLSKDCKIVSDKQQPKTLSMDIQHLQSYEVKKNETDKWFPENSNLASIQEFKEWHSKTKALSPFFVYPLVYQMIYFNDKWQVCQRNVVKWKAKTTIKMWPETKKQMVQTISLQGNNQFSHSAIKPQFFQGRIDKSTVLKIYKYVYKCIQWPWCLIWHCNELFVPGEMVILEDHHLMLFYKGHADDVRLPLEQCTTAKSMLFIPNNQYPPLFPKLGMDTERLCPLLSRLPLFYSTEIGKGCQKNKHQKLPPTSTLSSQDSMDGVMGLNPLLSDLLPLLMNRKEKGPILRCQESLRGNICLPKKNFNIEQELSPCAELGTNTLSQWITTARMHLFDSRYFMVIARMFAFVQRHHIDSTLLHKFCSSISIVLIIEILERLPLTRLSLGESCKEKHVEGKKQQSVYNRSLVLKPNSVSTLHFMSAEAKENKAIKLTSMQFLTIKRKSSCSGRISNSRWISMEGNLHLVNGVQSSGLIIAIIAAIQVCCCGGQQQWNSIAKGNMKTLLLSKKQSHSSSCEISKPQLYHNIIIDSKLNGKYVYRYDQGCLCWSFTCMTSERVVFAEIKLPAKLDNSSMTEIIKQFCSVNAASVQVFHFLSVFKRGNDETTQQLSLNLFSKLQLFIENKLFSLMEEGCIKDNACETKQLMCKMKPHKLNAEQQAKKKFNYKEISASNRSLTDSKYSVEVSARTKKSHIISPPNLAAIVKCGYRSGSKRQLKLGNMVVKWKDKNSTENCLQLVSKLKLWHKNKLNEILLLYLIEQSSTLTSFDNKNGAVRKIHPLSYSSTRWRFHWRCMKNIGRLQLLAITKLPLPKGNNKYHIMLCNKEHRTLRHLAMTETIEINAAVRKFFLNRGFSYTVGKPSLMITALWLKCSDYAPKACHTIINKEYSIPSTDGNYMLEKFKSQYFSNNEKFTTTEMDFSFNKYTSDQMQ